MAFIIRPKYAARAIKLAAWYEDREPGCDPIARADYDGCTLTLRSIEPYTDRDTEETQRVLQFMRRVRRTAERKHDAMHWNTRLAAIAEIAGDALTQ